MTQTCIELGQPSRSQAPAAQFEPEIPGDIAPRRNLIEAAVAQVFGVHSRELQSLTRGRAHVALARQVAMYLTHVLFGLSLTETGDLFDRDRTTVAHACTVIEDMRDDVVFDRVIELLESVVPALVAPRGSRILMYS
jgi:hypothetical protein